MQELQIQDTTVTGYTGTASEITLPEGITAIAHECFRNQPIRSIRMPDSIHSIGAEAFSGTQLVHVELPASLRFLEYRTFHNCRELQSVTLPAGLVGIGGDVFSGCDALTPPAIPESVRYLYGSFFGDREICSSCTSFGGYDSLRDAAQAACERIRTAYEAIPGDTPPQGAKELPFGRFRFYYTNEEHIDSKDYDVGFRRERICRLGENEALFRSKDGDLTFQIFVDIPTFDSGDREYDSYERLQLRCTPEGMTAYVEHGGYRISSIRRYDGISLADGKTRWMLAALGIGSIGR